MPIPRVAIVGRPNVGKSSLMNMIAGAKVSIVDPTPGVTRDRVTAIAEVPAPDNAGPSRAVEFIDTGGFGAYTAPGERYDEVGEDLHTLTNSIEFQIGQAIHDSDIVLFVLDAQAGVTPQDELIARLIREGRLGPGGDKKKRSSSTPGGKAAAKTTVKTAVKSAVKAAGPLIRIVANKTDGPRWESHAAEVAGLGLGEPLMVSAKSNYMRREFLDEIYRLLPKHKPDPEPAVDLKVAMIGKRNAGKSTLVNTLAGEPRVIVSEIAGTTRDAIDVRFQIDGRSVLAIDTAGVRRQKSFQSMIEFFAFDRVKRAVDRAQVVLLLIDATEKISQVDEQVAMLCQKTYKPCIIVVNKWDLAAGKPNRHGRPTTTGDYEEYLRKELGGLTYAPIAFISGKSGSNVRQTLDLAFELKEQALTRVTTGVLNRIVRRIMETRAPSDTTGKSGKVYYVAQTSVMPPTITMVVNDPELFRSGFMRFLLNRFREELPFVEVPIKIVIRERRQREGDLALDESTHVKTREGVVKRPRPGKATHATMRSETLVEGDRELTASELDQFAESAESYFDDSPLPTAPGEGEEAQE